MTNSDADRIRALISGQETDPFSFLGVHQDGNGFLARAYLPDARKVKALTIDGKVIGMLEHVEGGVFAGPIKLKQFQPIRYRVTYDTGDHEVSDPYSFGPVLGPLDDHYMSEGSHLRLFDKLGAHAAECPMGNMAARSREIRARLPDDPWNSDGVQQGLGAKAFGPRARH